MFSSRGYRYCLQDVPRHDTVTKNLFVDLSHGYATQEKRPLACRLRKPRNRSMLLHTHAIHCVQYRLVLAAIT